MRNECVIIDSNNMDRYNRCDFCNFKEHIDMQGIVSVDPLYEDLWFCSTNCLHSKKYEKKAKDKQEEKNKRSKRTNKRQKTIE